MFIQCYRCKYIWDYTGKSGKRITCPKCGGCFVKERYRIIERKELIPLIILDMYGEIEYITREILELQKEFKNL